MFPPSSAAAAAHAYLPGEYSPEERNSLLQLAREAIMTTLEGQPFAFGTPSAHLAELRGAFTSLHLDGRLRGCVGYVAPVLPLYQTVIDTAIAAAFRDNRFEPVSASEVPRIHIEISVLSSLQPIRAEDIRIGTHGLVVSLGPWRGLLLPQVPLQWNWDREEFLGQACRKAGLAIDAWTNGAVLEAFTAEIFGDTVPIS